MGKAIANKYYVSDWTASLVDRHSGDWSNGIKIIRSRFESRYFDQIDVLQNSNDTVVKYNCGFLIMSIDCLLIETLNQFFLGLYHTEELYKGRNADTFADFFNYSAYFPFFKGNAPASKEFYKQIRCGLLHQAESKTQSLINIRETEMIKPIDSLDFTQGLIVNRNLFHEALKSEFEKYLKDLENPDGKNINGDFLREKCHRKMWGIVS